MYAYVVCEAEEQTGHSRYFKKISAAKETNWISKVMTRMEMLWYIKWVVKVQSVNVDCLKCI